MGNWQLGKTLWYLDFWKEKKKEKKEERMIVGLLWKVGIVVGL